MRPYQCDANMAIDAAFASGMIQRGLVVMPTGTGKTRLFSEVVKDRCEKGGKALVLAHVEELIDQGVNRLKGDNPGLRVSKEQASNQASYTSDVVVASVQTIGKSGSNRLSWFKPDIVICDEAHHAAADTYMNVFRRFGCFTPGGTDLLGVTATPHRLDNKPLHGTESAIFEDIVYTYLIKDAIRDGYLCDLRAFRVRAGYDLSGVKKTAGDYNNKQLAEVVDNHSENLQAFKHWRDVAADRKTIVFCVNVEHAEHMAHIFNTYDIDAKCVSGKTSPDERRRIIEDFRTGEIQVLTNCNIATEGFDVPDVGCVLLLRPTQSWSLFVQMVGRGLRIAPGKTDCIVIDVVGTGENKSLTSVPEMFGLPKSFESKGSSMKDAFETFDELEDWQKQKLAMRQFDLTSIDSVLREVDILAELKPPPEVVSASKFSWMPLSSDSYLLACGDSRDGRATKRQAFLWADTIGRWQGKIVCAEGYEQEYALGAVTFDTAISRMDDAVNKTWPDARYLVDQSAPWRQRTNLSDKQRHWLDKAGYSSEQISQMTMGDASSALDKFFRSTPKQKRGA